VKNIAVVFESKALKDFLDLYVGRNYPESPIDFKVSREIIRDLSVFMCMLFDEELLESEGQYNDNPEETSIVQLLYALDTEVKEQYPDHLVNIIVPVDMTGMAMAVLTVTR
jgi:hypothetical protein